MRLISTFVMLFFLLCTPTFANESDVKLVAQMEEAVVKIIVTQQGIPISHGAGFFVSKDGLIITNRHVAGPALSARQLELVIETKSGKKIKDVKLVRCGSDEKDLDLCSLKIDFQPKKFFAVSNITPPKGEDVLVIGHPRGYDYTLSTGIVSNISKRDAPLSTKRYETIPQTEFVQVTAPISPGNSGGPIFDRKGNLLAVSTWIRTDTGSQNLNFAISANEVKAYIRDTDKPISMAAFNKLKTESAHALAKLLKKENNNPIFAALDGGKILKNLPLDMQEQKLSMGGHHVSVLIPSPPKAKIACRPIRPYDLTSFVCGIPGSRSVILTVGLQAIKPGVLAPQFHGKPIAEPQPLPLLKGLMESKQWDTMKKTLTPTQIKYLYSVPHNWTCKVEKKNPRYFWNNAHSCSGVIFNDGEADASTFFYGSQVDTDDYMIIASITIDDPGFVDYFYDWPVLIVGSAIVEK